MGTCTICKQQIRMIKNNEQVSYFYLFLLVQHMVFSNVIYRAANEPSAIFTILEKVPRRAFSWLKAPKESSGSFATLVI